MCRQCSNCATAHQISQSHPIPATCKSVFLNSVLKGVLFDVITRMFTTELPVYYLYQLESGDYSDWNVNFMLLKDSEKIGTDL